MGGFRSLVPFQSSGKITRIVDLAKHRAEKELDKHHLNLYIDAHVLIIIIPIVFRQYITQIRHVLEIMDCHMGPFGRNEPVLFQATKGGHACKAIQASGHVARLGIPGPETAIGTGCENVRQDETANESNGIVLALQNVGPFRPELRGHFGLGTLRRPPARANKSLGCYPNGLRVLRDISPELLQAVRDTGYPLKTRRWERHDGTSVMNSKESLLSDDQKDLEPIGIRRSKLQTVLYHYARFQGVSFADALVVPKNVELF